MKFTNFSIQWVLVYLVSIIGAWLCIDSGHEFGDDFILYVDQAERFWNVTDYQWLQRENEYCMQHSDQLIGPYLYPRGFPFFLSIFIGLKNQFGWESIKLINFLFFLFSSAVFLHRTEKKHSISPIYLIIMGIALLWNPKIWEAADRLQSDLFFASLVMLFWTVWWNDRGSKIVRWILLMVLVFWATLTKTNGVLLLIPIGFRLGVKLFLAVNRTLPNGGLTLKKYAEFEHWNVNGLNFKIEDILGIVGVIFGGFFALWMEKNTGANHWKELLNGGIVQVWASNFIQYWGMLGVLPGWHTINVLKSATGAIHLPELWVWVPFALLTIGVLITMIKNGISIVGVEISLFIVLNLILLTIWPSQQGVRMLFPLYPLWILVFFLVFKQFINSRERRFKAFFISPILRRVIMTLILIQGSMTAVHYINLDTNRAFSQDMKELSQFIRESTDEDAVISFFKPRLLRYQTGRRVIRLENTVDYSNDRLVLKLPVDVTALLSAGIDYYIVPREYSFINPKISSGNIINNSDNLRFAQTKYDGNTHWVSSVALSSVKNNHVESDFKLEYPVVFENQQFKVYNLGAHR